MQGYWENGAVKRLLGCVAIVVMVIPASSCSREAASSSVESPVRARPGANKITITGDDRVLWNGRVVSLEQLATLLEQTRQMPVQPELQFQPDVDASYDLSAKVLDVVKNSTVTKFGFVGNEMYSEDDQTAAAKK